MSEPDNRLVEVWARLQALSDSVHRRQQAIERGELNVLPDTPASKRRTFVVREFEMEALDGSVELLRSVLGLDGPQRRGDAR